MLVEISGGHTGAESSDSLTVPNPTLELSAMSRALGQAPSYNVSFTATQMQENEFPEQRWLTVRKLAIEFKDSTSEAALRNLIWQAEAYAKHPKHGLTSNSFLPVIVRPPNQRKVLLDKVEFVKWLTSSSAASRNTLAPIKANQ